MPRRRAEYKDKYKRFEISGSYEALVVDVYDGDTITVVFDPFPESQYSADYWFKVRLDGIDTPEKRPSKASSNADYEKKLAKEATRLLSDRILNNTIQLEIKADDSAEKFGRLLGTIFIDGENINEWMLGTNLAVVYGGGTKMDWGSFMDGEYFLLNKN